MNANYQLDIYTYPAMRGTPSLVRSSEHETAEAACAHLEFQAGPPFAYAVLLRDCYGDWMPARWDGTFVPLVAGETWPQIRGTNGEHPAYLAYLADKEILLAEIRAEHRRTGEGMIYIAGRLMRKRHPSCVCAEILAREAVQF